jgi:hypothetical protein
MGIIIKKAFFMVLILSVAACGCGSNDLSTPEKNVESLYRAISKKDYESYSKCFYLGGELRADDIRIAANTVFKYVMVIKHTIIERREVSPEKVELKIEEISQRENGLKYASTFIVKYIRVGKEWKILNSEHIETKRIS